jgi:NADPH:quinone reductase-like Zn-dependent oxidoreductase
MRSCRGGIDTYAGNHEEGAPETAECDDRSLESGIPGGRYSRLEATIAAGSLAAMLPKSSFKMTILSVNIQFVKIKVDRGAGRYLREDILRHGTYGKLVAGPVEAFARKPRRLSWAEAAGLPLPGLTAYRAIVRILTVQENETVLVHGASGAVGSLAAQITLSRGAHVIGSGAETNHAFLQSLGVEPVVYGEGLVHCVRELALEGVDAVLDCGGHGALATTPEVGNARVRACSIVEFVSGYPVVFARREQADLVALGDLADAGRLVVRVGRSFPLEQAADAQRALREGRANGKVVLEIT